MSSISREDVATRFIKRAESTNQAWQNFKDGTLRLYTAFSTTLALIAIIVLVTITHEGIWLSIGTACLAIAVLVTAREMEDARTIAIKVLTLCVFVCGLNY
ncbi:MAG TPA: hypothetical protein VKQ72_08085, partial [Aggregatilineales bacterium]|nr:hypothetical protein [Aggregatilineales bacterium]